MASDPANPDIQRLREFVAELERQRTLIVAQLAAAEPDSSEILRALHSIKGCASIMGEEALARVAHDLEGRAPDGVRARLSFLDTEIARIARRLRAQSAAGAPSTGQAIGRMTTSKTDAAGMLHAFEQKVQRFAREHGKQVDFRVDARTRKFFSESTRPLFSALVHAIINAIDHGIESPDERAAAGKRPVGSIELVISRDAVVVRDDGRGVRPQEVADRAIEQGLLPSERVAQMSEQERLQLVFLPALTLAREVTRTSGRGVGLNGVLREAERLGGTAWIESTPGEGTEIHVELVPRGRA